MNHIDPSAPNTLLNEALNRELSVEEVALIEQANEELTLFPEGDDRAPLSHMEQTYERRLAEIEASLPLNERRAGTTYSGALQPSASETISGNAPTGANVSAQQEAVGQMTQPASSVEALKIRAIKRKISGRYANCPRPWKLELRVDVDGFRPGKMLSGDFYYSSGSTVSYFGSFRVDAPNIRVSSSQVTIIGVADTTWPTSYKKLKVIIPRHNIFQPAANAYVQWYTLTNKKGADCTCLYESPYFRNVQMEEDREEGVNAFNTYNTASLPSGGPNRLLSVSKAYAEAGVQIQSTGASNVIPTSEAGADHKWNNAELHDAMEKHFSLWENLPGWKAWLFHANAHEYGPGLLGIMYDQKDQQRQGCATFYQTINNSTTTDLRTQLYVNVHELGHCFNLYHSFHKSYMNPPIPNRPAALSWMNYPQYFPGGESAFWSAFPFQFDDLELAHLRHGFRNAVAMGGNPFGTGASAESSQSFMDNISDQSGLKVAVQAPAFVQLGTPIHVDISVTNISDGPRAIFEDIHPNNGLVQIALQKPNGKIVNYHPPISQLVLPKRNYLQAGEKIEETSYIGFDAEEGQVFDAPGGYQLFATYYCPDGSAIRSNVARVNVKSPSNIEDEKVAELMLGEQQGMLFFLEGSDSQFLRSGNDALAELMDRYTDHALTSFVRVTEGIKASRTFVQIDTERKINVQKSNESVSRKLLSSILKQKPEQLGITPQVQRIAQKHLDGLDGPKAEKKTKEKMR